MALRRAISTSNKLRMAAAVGPRSAVAALPVRGGGDHGIHAYDPPYARLPKTSKPLHEQDELVWNDGVAPEACLDFDAPHISKGQGLLMWLGGFAFFYGVWLFAKSRDQPAKKLSGPRELPEETKTVSLGSYPHGKY